MKVLFDKDYSELKAIVCGKEDITIIKDVIAYYPVTWSTVREMLLNGLEASKIKALCEEWHRRGYIISDTWDICKYVIV